MDRARMARTLRRIASEIVERHPGLSGVVLVGIRSRGVPLAARLAQLTGDLARGSVPPVGALDITLYRDDLTALAPHPILRGTDIPGSIDARTVILVDDVLYTGRTVRAALDELIDFGRPARIELAVLVDRGRRELPIHADYAGKLVTTGLDENVQVSVEEQDGADRVVLLEKKGARAARKPRTLAKSRAIKRSPADGKNRSVKKRRTARGRS